MTNLGPGEKRRRKLARLRYMLAKRNEDIELIDEAGIPIDDMELAERAALKWAVKIGEEEIIRQTDATFLEKRTRHDFDTWFKLWKELREHNPSDAAEFVKIARRFVTAVDYDRAERSKVKREARLARKDALERIEPEEQKL